MSMVTGTLVYQFSGFESSPDDTRGEGLGSVVCFCQPPQQRTRPRIVCNNIIAMGVEFMFDISCDGKCKSILAACISRGCWS